MIIIILQIYVFNDFKNANFKKYDSFTLERHLSFMVS